MYLTERELAQRWHVHRATIARLRGIGRLGFTRIGQRRVVYPLVAVERYEREHTQVETVVGLSTRRNA